LEAALSAKQYVKYGNHGFWAYDVALGVFLKHLIDVAEARDGAPMPWLTETVSWWRVVACTSDYGLTIDDLWPAERIALFVDLADAACTAIAARNAISAQEVTSWHLLEGNGIFPRGAVEVKTGPVVELGRAIIDLVSGQIPETPAGRQWLYGTPSGRTTLGDASSEGRPTTG
jgi:hypothetical protein